MDLEFWIEAEMMFKSELECLDDVKFNQEEHIEDDKNRIKRLNKCLTYIRKKKERYYK